MSALPASRPRGAPERALVAAAVRHLEAQGYRTWPDLDGRDYFDLVARRGDEIGLVEAKVVGAREALAQALRRRAWGDWVAVVLGSPRAASALSDRTAATRAAPVGVWCVVGGEVHEVRAARSRSTGGESDPFAESRARFGRVLDALESGALPSGVRWDGLLREIRRASGGRGFREWRLEELAP